jgi:hypothetical protein
LGKLGRRNSMALGGAGDGTAASFIEILPCNSDFRAALNSGRGIARNGRTSETSAAIFGCEFGPGSGRDVESSALMA